MNITITFLLLLMPLVSFDAFATCTPPDVFEKERAYMAESEGGFRVDVFGVVVVLPPRHHLNYKRNLNDETIISGYHFPVKGQGYLGCKPAIQLSGDIVIGYRRNCKTCDLSEFVDEAKNFSRAELEGFESFVINGVSVDRYFFIDDAGWRSTYTDLYDNEYYFTIYDDNPYIAEEILNKLKERKGTTGSEHSSAPVRQNTKITTSLPHKAWEQD